MDLKSIFPNIEENEQLSSHTTFGVGGVARWFLSIQTIENLKEAILKVKQYNIPYLILAGGSNIIFPENLDKLIIYISSIKQPVVSDNFINCEAGQPLSVLVSTAIQNNLSGLEQLSGIPGTVGGAIVGNAGAYGREISNSLVSVKVFDGQKEKEFTKEDCCFSYRNSFFKNNPELVVLSAKFLLEKGDSFELQKTSQEIIKKREEKYPPNLKCPGSFYKNILVSDLTSEQLKKVPEDKIMFGKIPAGFLLEAVGARGMKEGNIMVADYHGNLIINNGGGTLEEVMILNNKLKQKVQDLFGIDLEEEVRLVNNTPACQ